MTQPKITVDLAPQSIEKLAEAFRRAYARENRGHTTVLSGTEVWEAVTIQVQPRDGVRFMFVDDTGESHWVAPDKFMAANAVGWRQAWVRMRER